MSRFSTWRGGRSERRALLRAEAIAAEEHIRQEIANQWAEAHPEPRDPSDLGAGPSNLTRGRVPYGVDLAAAWAWRFLVISAAMLAILWTLRHFTVVVMPLVIALFIAALMLPVVEWLTRHGVKRGIAAFLAVLLVVSTITLMLTFAGTQVASGVSNLSGQIVDGLEKIRTWLQTGPFHASDSQINSLIHSAQNLISKQGTDLSGKITEVGSAVGHIVAGLFIILFATYYFLADGAGIWAWTVRIFPRSARAKVDGSGRAAFKTLVQFVRATVLVAATDALGVVIIAAILGMPFLSAIGVLVFLSAFIPMIGAFLSGGIAVLIALVAKGPITAVIMLGGVVFVQQLESHVLQPFLMGRFVRVHPLAVIVSIAMGIVLMGIPGALIAVPIAASVNSIVNYLTQSPLAPRIEPEPEVDQPV
ncbi:MAG TPA: AI-2E family transporter [Marmoricola sp.]|nr:AI-2E family transporter [Marmoricola sp.]